MIQLLAAPVADDAPNTARDATGLLRKAELRSPRTPRLERPVLWTANGRDGEHDVWDEKLGRKTRSVTVEFRSVQLVFSEHVQAPGPNKLSILKCTVCFFGTNATFERMCHGPPKSHCLLECMASSLPVEMTLRCIRDSLSSFPLMVFGGGFPKHPQLFWKSALRRS